MTLHYSPTKEALASNVQAEMKAGKSRKDSVASALKTQNDSEQEMRARSYADFKNARLKNKA